MNLHAYLNAWAGGRPVETAVATTIGRLAEAAYKLGEAVGRGPLADDMHELIAHHADGDAQQAAAFRAVITRLHLASNGIVRYRNLLHLSGFHGINQLRVRQRRIASDRSRAEVIENRHQNHCDDNPQH